MATLKSVLAFFKLFSLLSLDQLLVAHEDADLSPEFLSLDHHSVLACLPSFLRRARACLIGKRKEECERIPTALASLQSAPARLFDSGMLSMGILRSASLGLGSESRQNGNSARKQQEIPAAAAAAAAPLLLECGYYDVQQVQHISKALLLTLGAASVEKTTGDLFNSAKSVAPDVRKEMLEFLNQQCDRYAGTSGHDEDDYPVRVIEGFLEMFVRSKKTLFRRVSSKFLLSSSSSESKSDDRIDELVAELDRSGAWPVGRRDSVAKLLLKGVDKMRTVHCEKRFQSNGDLMQHKLKCSLRPVDCSSHRCDAVFSAARAPEHDAVCLFKLLPCEQNCRAMVMRGEMGMHCSSTCPMKPVSCPFLPVGCSQRLPQGDIHRHCEQEMGAHLLSVLQALQRLDSSTANQSQRLVLLEKAMSITQRFEAADIGSLTLTVREQETRIKSLEQELSKLRQEVKVTDVSAEVLQLRRELRSLQKRVDSQN